MQRALRFGLVGLTLHGPFFYTGFRALDQTFGAKATLKNVRAMRRDWCDVL
jgi:hypothetical protein